MKDIVCELSLATPERLLSLKALEKAWTTNIFPTPSAS